MLKIEVIKFEAQDIITSSETHEHIYYPTGNENENAELTEKHTPKLEEENDKRFVRLKYHPMIPEHYIQFIEIYPKDKSRLYLKYLNPNEIAEFDITHFEENIEALEHCNIHGLWRNNND